MGISWTVAEKIESCLVSPGAIALMQQMIDKAELERKKVVIDAILHGSCDDVLNEWLVDAALSIRLAARDRQKALERYPREQITGESWSDQ